MDTIFMSKSTRFQTMTWYLIRRTTFAHNFPEVQHEGPIGHSVEPVHRHTVTGSIVSYSGRCDDFRRIIRRDRAVEKEENREEKREKEKKNCIITVIIKHIISFRQDLGYQLQQDGRLFDPLSTSRPFSGKGPGPGDAAGMSIGFWETMR